jgi:esterase/lipase superfamily enzyme
LTIFGFTFWHPNEDEKKHFTLREIRTLDREGLVRVLKQGQKQGAMVYVHGYNNSFEDALFKTAQLAFDAHFPGVPIAFSWPSKNGVADYDYDHDSADFSSDAFLQLLRLVRRDAAVSKVYVVVHSLGNRILLDALAHLPEKDITLTEIIMAAPDIARENFVGRLNALKNAAKGLTLYASSADKAMLISRVKAGGVRAGDIPEMGPVVSPGMDTIDVTALGDDPFSLNHSVFSSNRSLIDDIGRLIRTGARPPGDRSPQLEPMPQSGPTRYWRYPK